MPTLAGLISATDSQIYPEDSQLQNIAKDVFVRRKLWDENINLAISDSDTDRSSRELQETTSTKLS